VRVLVTGANGFVGRWLVAELEAAGHEAVAAPPAQELDIADLAGVGALVASVRPDAVAHLAAVSFGPDASADPDVALRTNVGGTVAVVEAALAARVPLLAVSSSEVYRVRSGEPMPLAEDHPLGPRAAYGLSKAGAEGVVLGAVATRGLEAIVVRPFNHTGPGQRPLFAVPAFAGRILEAARQGDRTIRAGNVDAARDLSDVRDVVVAYRRLLELLVDRPARALPLVVNVASGRAIKMRDVIARLAAAVGHEVEIEIDSGLLRPDDPPVIVGNAALLRELTGWSPRIDLDETLRDVLEGARRPEPRSTPATQSA
jgi:GDP-4-dehydro-6-deoxy-D-mannose reductase